MIHNDENKVDERILVYRFQLSVVIVVYNGNNENLKAISAGQV